MDISRNLLIKEGFFFSRPSNTQRTKLLIYMTNCPLSDNLKGFLNTKCLNSVLCHECTNKLHRILNV